MLCNCKNALFSAYGNYLSDRTTADGCVVNLRCVKNVPLLPYGWQPFIIKRFFGIKGFAEVLSDRVGFHFLCRELKGGYCAYVLFVQVVAHPLLRQGLGKDHRHAFAFIVHFGHQLVGLGGNQCKGNQVLAAGSVGPGLPDTCDIKTGLYLLA